MSETPVAQSVGQTGTMLSWVEEARVIDVDSATDGFQIFCALATLAGGADLAAVVTLLASVKHPIPIYLSIAVLTALTLALGAMAIREWLRMRSARQRRSSSRITLPLSLSFSVVTATGAPTFSAGIVPSGQTTSITG